MLDRELVKETQELLDEVLRTSSTRVQAEILTVVSETTAWLAEQAGKEASSEKPSKPPRDTADYRVRR